MILFLPSAEGLWWAALVQACVTYTVAAWEAPLLLFLLPTGVPLFIPAQCVLLSRVPQVGHVFPPVPCSVFEFRINFCCSGTAFLDHLEQISTVVLI